MPVQREMETSVFRLAVVRHVRVLQVGIVESDDKNRILGFKALVYQKIFDGQGSNLQTVAGVVSCGDGFRIEGQGRHDGLLFDFNLKESNLSVRQIRQAFPLMPASRAEASGGLRVRLTRKEPLCTSHDLFVGQKDAGHHVIFIQT